MKQPCTGILLVLLISLFPVSALQLMAQEPVRGSFCMVWYNAENLFYPEDDSLPGDDEFTPGGLYHWTWSRYREKLTSLAKVIIAAGRGEAPGLVALCEVENAQVLEDLITHPILAPCRYSYFHRESMDHRGMDVACLVRMERIRTLDWEAICPKPPVIETRDYVHLNLSWGGDSLDLFLVHLISKYGGVGATAELRRCQLEELAGLMDSVYAERERGHLMIFGDFNDSYDSYAMEAMKSARFGSDSLRLLLPENGPGTYKYRGRWMPIDQVMVHPSFAGGSVRVSSLYLPFLLTEDQKYGGSRPKRCYTGMQYIGGISDHLPLLIDLSPFIFSIPPEP